MAGDTETFSKGRVLIEGDDFPSIAVDVVGKINWKMAIFLFTMMVFVLSDVFIELSLSGVKDAVEGDCPTTKGTLIQIIVIVIGYIILDLLTKGGIL